jgi:cobalt-zinc-cadmium efflux system membrane fusion protein
MNKLFILASLCIFTASCKQNNKSADEIADIQYDGDTVLVSENSTVFPKIKLYTVAEQNFCAEFNATGTVQAMAGKMAGIASPFDGRVSKSFVQLGQKTGAGTPVFELHSTEFFEATKHYFQSLQTKKMKESNLQRQRDLVKNGIGAAKDLEEAETDCEIAVKDCENATATLKMLNLNPDDITMGQALKVVSPIAGEVVQANIVIGQYVKSDAAPLVTVAELSKVWVVAQVKEKHLSAIHTGNYVEVRTDADPGKTVAGRISHISELLDEDTRSVQVFITCDNKERRLKPGMFANVRFISRPETAILIPATALLQTEEDTYIFIRQGKDRFVKRKVQASTANPHEALITGGLKAGEVIVSEGGIYLMAF